MTRILVIAGTLAAATLLGGWGFDRQGPYCLFDPDFTSETPQGTLDRDGFKQYVLGWREGFPDIHCDVDDLIEEGDRVAWSVRAKGTHQGDFMGIPATGRTIDFDSLNIGEFRDGRGYRHQVLMNETKMMTQLGMMPAGDG